jgi:hypothetical protein
MMEMHQKVELDPVGRLLQTANTGVREGEPILTNSDGQSESTEICGLWWYERGRRGGDGALQGCFGGTSGGGAAVMVQYEAASVEGFDIQCQLAENTIHFWSIDSIDT